MLTASTANRTMSAHILLVDDNQMGLRVRKVVLEELGYQVTALCCSVEAFQHFCAQRFDLVVTDYRMPKLDGIQLTARIRERAPGMPVILISGIAEPLGLDESNTGADAVVQKNSHEIPTLTRAITRLLSRKTQKKPPHRHSPAPRRSSGTS